MKTTELKKEGLNLHMQVQIPSQTIDEKILSALQNEAKTKHIQGFRKGKVPLNIMKQKFGAAVRQKVIDHEINHAISHIVKDHKLNIALKPTIDNIINEGSKDLQFVVKFELMPEITLPNFADIKLEAPKIKTSKKDTEEYFANFLKAFTTFETKAKGKAEKGDQVIINTEGSIKGKVFPEGTMVNHPLILGSETFIPGFEDQLLEAAEGDEINVKVTFPKDYHAQDLAGKKAEFKVNIIELKKPVLPELNEEFFKKFNCNTEDELKEQVTKIFIQQFEDQIKILQKKKLFDNLEAQLTFEVPASLLDREVNNLTQQAKNAERSDNDALPEKDRKFLEKLAIRRVRIGLMLSEYAKQKNIQVDISDLKQAILNQARQYPGNENVIIDFYNNNPQAVEGLKGAVIEDKSVEHILKNDISVTHKEYTKSQLEKLIQAEEKDAED